MRRPLRDISTVSREAALAARHDRRRIATVTDDPVEIVPYDPRWPEEFQRESAHLAAAFADLDIEIEHIGSTAVPGLASKPIVDVMVGLRDLSVLDDRREALRTLGYEPVEWTAAASPNHRFFVKRVQGRRAFHLHVDELGSKFRADHLRFRDRLRADSRLASRYADLKMRLARTYPRDREAYTAGKSTFIEMAR